jgi:cobalamin biosynthesis protein CobT
VKGAKEGEEVLAVDAERQRTRAREEIDRLRTLLDEKEKELDDAISGVHAQKQRALAAEVAKAKAALERIPGMPPLDTRIARDWRG